MKIIAADPSETDDEVVCVYPSAKEEVAVGDLELTSDFLYGLLIRHRDKAPEWMKAKITMLDISTPPYNQIKGNMSAHGIPGIGYKGTRWYAIQDDAKYAIEAGVDLSNLNNP